MPLIAGPSSSPVIRRLIEPAKSGLSRDEARAPPRQAGDAALHVDGAAAIQLAVRDHAGERIGCVQPLTSPGGTTSVWPAKSR